jgi:hypothetical protein
MRKEGMHYSSHVEQHLSGTNSSQVLNSMLRPEVSKFLAKVQPKLEVTNDLNQWSRDLFEKIILCLDSQIFLHFAELRGSVACS